MCLLGADNVQKAEILFDAIDADGSGDISKFEMNDFCSK
jgi:hypothetical protein